MPSMWGMWMSSEHQIGLVEQTVIDDQPRIGDHVDPADSGREEHPLQQHHVGVDVVDDEHPGIREGVAFDGDELRRPVSRRLHLHVHLEDVESDRLG